MSTVTQRINEIKQPWGGYLPVKDLKITCFEDQRPLPESSLSPILTGLLVDDLSRYRLGEDVEKAFEISVLGYVSRLEILSSRSPDPKQAFQDLVRADQEKGIEARQLLDQVTGLSNTAILAALKLVSYDIWYRDPVYALHQKPAVADTLTDEDAFMIRILVERTVRFFESVGPVVETGFRFDGAYTGEIENGDGDFLTKRAIWDLKVSKNRPTSKQTLQILIYYLMAKQSGIVLYRDVDEIGLFNPKLNCSYSIEISSIPDAVLEAVREQVIGYVKNHAG